MADPEDEINSNQPPETEEIRLETHYQSTPLEDGENLFQVYTIGELEFKDDPHSHLLALQMMIYSLCMTHEIDPYELLLEAEANTPADSIEGAVLH